VVARISGIDVGLTAMKTVAEYRLYADECRKLAERMIEAKDKQALETIARAWERVANEREATLLKQVGD
jgi:hypothetical protein